MFITAVFTPLVLKIFNYLFFLTLFFFFQRQEEEQTLNNSWGCVGNSHANFTCKWAWTLWYNEMQSNGRRKGGSSMCVFEESFDVSIVGMETERNLFLLCWDGVWWILKQTESIASSDCITGVCSILQYYSWACNTKYYYYMPSQCVRLSVSLLTIAITFMLICVYVNIVQIHVY